MTDASCRKLLHRLLYRRCSRSRRSEDEFQMVRKLNHRLARTRWTKVRVKLSGAFRRRGASRDQRIDSRPGCCSTCTCPAKVAWKYWNGSGTHPAAESCPPSCSPTPNESKTSARPTTLARPPTSLKPAPSVKRSASSPWSPIFGASPKENPSAPTSNATETRLANADTRKFQALFPPRGLTRSESSCANAGWKRSLPV
jgi:hypothetical protein